MNYVIDSLIESFNILRGKSESRSLFYAGLRGCPLTKCLQHIMWAIRIIFPFANYVTDSLTINILRGKSGSTLPLSCITWLSLCLSLQHLCGKLESRFLFWIT